jgi:hypothetical protein
MIAISQVAHEHMMTVAGPHAPVTQVSAGAFSVPSFTINVSYVVRFVATVNGALAECSCSDFTYRSTKTGQPCKHIRALYLYLADKAMETAHAA